MLIYQIHYEAVGNYLRLQEAAETALDQALQTVGHDPAAGNVPLTEAERTQLAETLEQAAQHTPGLLDFLEHAADDMIDDALNALRSGELCYHLFTPEETNIYSAHFLIALVDSGAAQVMPEDLSPQERAEVDQQINEAIAGCLDEIDTPSRRAELYAAARAALEQQQARELADSPTSYAALLLPLLDDAEMPLADNEFFAAAITGEFSLRWAAEADARDLDEDA
jgi:hypothetical protein